MKPCGIILAGFVLSLTLIPPALADAGRGRREPRQEAWHGEIHRFNEHDLALWRSGRWLHGRHEGRLGWWWIVGGVWYFYPARVYPYPDPYQPPIVVLPPAEAQPQYWYYCTNPAGYYPYVANCATVWQRVPASPAPAGQPAPAVPVPPPPYPR